MNVMINLKNSILEVNLLENFFMRLKIVFMRDNDDVQIVFSYFLIMYYLIM
jgi:hypothetical protein